MSKRETLSSLPAADLLIEAAERLIGERGLEGVSLRQISKAAGQGNNYAVQYHFGDFAGLIGAIQERRLREVEQRRAALLAEARGSGRLDDVRVLTDLLYRPLIEVGEGERRYARFVLAMLGSPDVAKYSSGLFEAMPSAVEVLELLHRLCPELPMPLVLERQRLIAIMVLTSIFNRRPLYDRPENDRALIENALGMASAAMMAPVGPGVSTMIAVNG